MPEQSPAAEVAFDDYPNVATTRRLDPQDNHTGVFEFPPLNGHAKTSVKPSKKLSLWRSIRKLIRKRAMRDFEVSTMNAAEKIIGTVRKECSTAVRDAKSEVAKVRSEWAKEASALTKRIANRDQALDELRQRLERETGELRETIARREKDIKTHVELEIPKLKRELEVERAHVKYLKTLVAEKLIHEEAQIAVDNRRVVDAETMIEQLRQSQIAQRIQ